jgi:hypothetical protein
MNSVLLKSMLERLENWDNDSTLIGDIFLDVVITSNEMLVTCPGTILETILYQIYRELQCGAKRPKRVRKEFNFSSLFR